MPSHLRKLLHGVRTTHSQHSTSNCNKATRWRRLFDSSFHLLAQIVVTQAAHTAHAQDTHTPPDVKTLWPPAHPSTSTRRLPTPHTPPHLCLARSASRWKNGPALTLGAAYWACAGARLRCPCRPHRPDCCSSSCPRDTHTTTCQNGRQHT